MAVRPGDLGDKSALVRLPNREVNAVLAPLLRSGAVATCGVIELEVLYSARNYEEFVRTRRVRSGFTLVPMTQADFERATDVMMELARRGLHGRLACLIC